MSKEEGVTQLHQHARAGKTHGLSEYGGPQVAPTVGAGTQGAQFRAMTAPKVDGDWFGGAVSQWGKYQAKLLDEADEAIANDIARRVRDHAVFQRTDKQIGYMNLKGADATSVDQDGKNLADQTINSLESFANGLIEDRKLTPRQRQKLMPQLYSIYNNQYAHAMGHILDQHNAFIKESLEADKKSFYNQAASGYDNPDDIANAFTNLERIVGKECERDGVTGNAREMRIRDAKGEALYGAVVGAISAAQTDDNKIYYAEGLLRANGQYLNADKKDRLLSLINKKKDYVEVKNAGREANDRLGVNPGNIRYALPYGVRFGVNQGKIAEGDALSQATAMMDAVTVHVESGGKHFVTDSQGHQTVITGRYADGTMPPEEKRAFGIAQVTKGAAEWVYRTMDHKKDFTKSDWDRVVNDPDENRRVGAAYLAGMLMRYGQMDKAVAAYNCGPGNVDKAVKAGGANWRDHLPAETKNYLVKHEKKLAAVATPKDIKNRDGSVMSALDPDYARRSMNNFTRGQAEKYVLDHYPRARQDTEYRTSMVDEVMAEQKRRTDDFATGQSNALKRCYDTFLTGGRTGIDVNAFNSLTPKAQEEFRLFMSRREKGDDTGDYRLAARIAADPTHYFQLPDESWNMYRYQLSDRDWKHLDAQRITWQVKSGIAYNQDRARRANAEAGGVDYSFSSVGADAAFESIKKVFPELKDLDGVGKENLGYELQKFFAEWGSLKGVKLGANSPEMSEARHDAINKEFNLSGIVFDSKKNIFNVNFAKSLTSGGPTAPYDVLKSITQQVRHKQEVTDNEINAVAISLFLRRGNPVGNLDSIQMDKVAEEFITSEYVDAFKKEHGMDPRPDQMPNKLDIIRTYLKYSLMGKKVPQSWIDENAAQRARIDTAAEDGRTRFESQ